MPGAHVATLLIRVQLKLDEHIRRYLDMRATKGLGGDMKLMYMQRGVVRGLAIAIAIQSERRKGDLSDTVKEIERKAIARVRSRKE